MRTVRTWSLTLAASALLAIAPCHADAPRQTLTIRQDNAAVLAEIGQHTDLEVLEIHCLESLEALPDAIGTLTRLKELNLDNGNGCGMNPRLPESIGNLRALEKLVLYGAQDPRAGGPSTRHGFPRSMSQLQNLRYLDLGRNGLAEIPSFVGDLAKLEEFRFEFNMNLKAVPAFFSRLRALTTLKLNGNELDGLPDVLNTLPRLKRISLGNNCRITQNAARRKELTRRFPNVTFDFEDAFDCPAR